MLSTNTDTVQILKQARELELAVANCEQQLQASEAARTRGDARNLELARASAASAARMQVKPSC